MGTQQSAVEVGHEGSSLSSDGHVCSPEVSHRRHGNLVSDDGGIAQLQRGGDRVSVEVQRQRLMVDRLPGGEEKRVVGL